MRKLFSDFVLVLLALNLILLAVGLIAGINGFNVNLSVGDKPNYLSCERYQDCLTKCIEEPSELH